MLDGQHWQIGSLRLVMSSFWVMSPMSRRAVSHQVHSRNKADLLFQPVEMQYTSKVTSERRH